MGPTPRHRAQQLLLRPPDRTLLDGVVEVSIDRAPLALKPLDVGAKTAPHRRQRMLETMAFGDQYPHNLSASSEQGVEGDQRLIGQRPRRRADAFGEERERVRVDAVSVFASCPVARAKSRTWRGLTTTTGSRTAANAATAARS